MRRPGEAVELHQGPVQRQLPGRRLLDSAREVPPGPPSRPGPPGSAPDSQPPRGGGRLRPGGAHLCEGSPSSRLSHPPSLPGNFRTSGHELAVRGLGPRGVGEGQSPLPCPTSTAPSEGAWYPRRPWALPYKDKQKSLCFIHSRTVASRKAEKKQARGQYNNESLCVK